MLAQELEQGGINPEAFAEMAARVEDPADRIQIELLSAHAREGQLHTKQINVIGQRLVHLEQGVLVLIDQVARLAQERGQRP